MWSFKLIENYRNRKYQSKLKKIKHGKNLKNINKKSLKGGLLEFLRTRNNESESRQKENEAWGGLPSIAVSVGRKE